MSMEKKEIKSKKEKERKERKKKKRGGSNNVMRGKNQVKEKKYKV